jgi:hypothetical protein
MYPLQSTDVSEEHVAFILRVEGQAKQRKAGSALPPASCWFLDLFFNPENGSDMILQNVS